MKIKPLLYKTAAVVTAGAVFLVTLPLTLWVVSVVFLMAFVSSIVLAYKLRRAQRDGVVFTHVAEGNGWNGAGNPFGTPRRPFAEPAPESHINGSYRVVSE